MADSTTHSSARASGTWVLIAVGVGTFMSALDGSVVNAILPVMREALHTDVATIEWVVTVYLLSVSGLLLGFGRLGDVRGHKGVYVLGFGGFVISSALCGMAPGVHALIAFRALQAVGAAMLFANSPAILTKSFPAEKRGRVLGLQAMMTYLGLTVGPSLGGWLTQTFGWRSIFYINVPVGIVAVALSLRFVPRDVPAEAGESFDWTGAVLFLAGLVALLLGLNQGHAWGWGSPAIVALLAGAAVLLAIFVAVERRVRAPMLDLSLFRHATFSAATASALLNYICIYSLVFLLPFYLLQARSMNPAQAGLLLTAQPLVMMVAAPLSGALSDRIGSRWPAIVGMTVLSAGLLLESFLSPQTSLTHIALGLAVCGLGTGVFIAPNNSALMGAAPRHRQGIASGVLATARNVGMVLGVGLAGAILTTMLTGHSEPDSAEALSLAVSRGLQVAAGVAAVGVLFAAIRGRNAAGNSPAAAPPHASSTSHG
ncbi:MFS transporter [Hyalangium versicolor]|uniref:MFS transporter n=1 Tax=Hyalangium versicolor TaxID=2861190 RepID=UPI001CCE1CBB|nr:MFS transporter [Hyalangium versicolor]